MTRYVLSCGRFYCFICETLISDDYNSSRSRDDGGIILKTRVLALPPWTKFTSIGSIGLTEKTINNHHFLDFVLCGWHCVFCMHQRCASHQDLGGGIALQKRSTKSINRELFGYDGVVSTARNIPCVRIIKEPSVSGDAVLVFSSALLSPHK